MKYLTLSSYVLVDGLTKAGPYVRYAIDLMTAIGGVVMIHPDSDIVQLDLNFSHHKLSCIG